MTESSAVLGLLLVLCFSAFAYGLTMQKATLRGFGLALAAGVILICLEFAINYVASAIVWIPRRSVRDVLLFQEAVSGDVLIPIAYSCLLFALGSLVRCMATAALKFGKQLE
jgi:hypothetical protein